MQLPLYQIDAFAKQPFEGNPAAVIPLEQWLPDELMQSIAQENNLAETAFFVPLGQGYHIRWFTPTKEVKLCGHATLASAYVLCELLGNCNDAVEFDSLSGPLEVEKKGGVYTLRFPAQPPQPCPTPPALIRGLNRAPTECLVNDDYMAVFAHEDDIYAIEPDFQVLKELDRRGVIVTAPSERYDFVVRFFAPRYGIPEDPVTGSAYTQLMPYWSRRLGRSSLKARQLSSRGGDVACRMDGPQVLISGYACTYLQGTIEVEL